MNFHTRWLKTLVVSLICIIVFQSAHTPVAHSLNKKWQGEEVVVPEGTRLRLITAQEVSSKVAQVGDTVNFTVDEELAVGGHVVVRKGTPATGVVINSEKSGRMGKAGRLAIRVESTTTAGGETLRLRAAKGQEGDDKTTSTMALSMLVSSFFLLKKGKDATIKEGTKVEVYVAEEKRFRVEGSSLVAVNTPASAENSSGENGATGGVATVYIYRPNKWLGRALEPSVYADGVELARMDNGRFLTLRLTPGRHMIHMTDKKKGYEVNMGAGEVYYFRVGIETGMWKGQGKLILDDNERGAVEVKKLKPLGADKIKDRTLMSGEDAAPAREPITASDLKKLIWIEGTWRGTGDVDAPFFERYHFENDSTLVVESFSDETLGKVTEVTRFELKNGQFGNWGEGARWAATELNDGSITFEPVSSARNSFRWETQSKDAWKAILTWPEAESSPAKQKVYAMERWPTPK